MKKSVISIIALFFFCQVNAQAPDLNYYSQLGFSTGYGFEKYGNSIQNKGISFSLLHGSLINRYYFLESSALKFALYKGYNNQLKSISFEAVSFDVGLGYSSKNFFVGVAPLSVNLTESSNLGMAILSKARILKYFVIENKFMPFVYGDSSDYGFFNNNFFVGVHYWFDEYFSVGLRYNQYIDKGNFGIIASWNLL